MDGICNSARYYIGWLQSFDNKWLPLSFYFHSGPQLLVQRLPWTTCTLYTTCILFNWWPPQGGVLWRKWFGKGKWYLGLVWNSTCYYKVERTLQCTCSMQKVMWLIHLVARLMSSADSLKKVGMLLWSNFNLSWFVYISPPVCNEVFLPIFFLIHSKVNLHLVL